MISITKHPYYHVWTGMRQRCRNPRHRDYFKYGGRGITVCERWDSFSNFLQDMGKRPGPLHSIDRINNDGNYEPGNVHWATKVEQSINRRKQQNNTLGYIGIRRNPRPGKPWAAQISHQGKVIGIGYFDDIVEAAYVRDQAVMQLYSDAATLNFEY